MEANKSRHYDQITLDENFDPQVIKSFNNEQLNELSNKVRLLIIDKCSQYGGHLSSNLGVVELTIALFKYFNFPNDKLIFDIGHQSYTEKILTGRPLTNLREKDGIDGFQKRNESIYDTYEGGHSSTSISAAMGLAVARDLKHENYKVICVIGDSSIANGLALEAINNLSNFHHQLLIIINDNDMSISQSVGKLHKLFQSIKLNKNIDEYNGNEELLDLLYGGPVDGHNISDLLKAFKKINNCNRPVVLHVKTIKGKGYSFAEKDNVGKYHFIDKFDVKTGLPLVKNEINKTTFSLAYSNLLYEAMKDNKELVCISPATEYGSNLTKIFSDYKDRAFDVGICEEHALIFANGLALNHIHPYVFIYSTFLQRTYDEIIHDIARLNSKVTIMVDHSGLIGKDGETHQGIYDLSFLMTIPNVTLAMAKDISEAKRLFDFSLNYNAPLFIRYPLYEVELDHNEAKEIKPLNYLEYDSLLDNKANDKDSLCLISYGPHLNEIYEKTKGYTNLKIVNCIFTYPLNLTYLKSLLNYKEILIYDPYSIETGFTMHLTNALVDLGYQGKIIKCTLPIEYVSKATILEQEEENKVDVNSLINKLKELL